MRKIGKWLVPLTLLVFVLSVPMVARAALYSGPWDSPDSLSTNLPTNPSIGGYNITSAQHAFVAGTHYFQINLADLINTTIRSTNGQEARYIIYIDTLSNGVGVDYTFSLDVKKAGSNQWKWGSTSTGSPTGTLTSIGLETNNFLQWSYNGNLTNDFNWWAQTRDQADAIAETSSTVHATPIPNAAWLLGSGIIGLIGLQRRKAKKA